MSTTTRPRIGAMRRQPCGCTLQYGISQGTGAWAVSAPCSAHRNEVNRQDYASRDWYAPYDDQRILVRELHAWQTARVEPAHGGRSWTILDGENTALDSGWAADEAGAMEAADDWAEDDLLCDALAEGALSEAFAAYGHTPEAAARAVLAVAVTDAFAWDRAG